MEALLTVKDLTGILQVTEQTIQRYVLAKEIPYRKIKRMIRFRPSEIDRWINSGGFKTTADRNIELEGGLFEENDTEAEQDFGAGGGNG
jgi:excisionase family DNA binding protein